jgi:hypothetical protein
MWAPKNFNFMKKESGFESYRMTLLWRKLDNLSVAIFSRDSENHRK